MDPKHLRRLLECGHRVRLEYKSWQTCTIYFFDKNWRFHSLSDYFDDDEISNIFTNEYKIVTTAPKLLQPWDRCVVLENVRELAEKDWWGVCAKESIWDTVFVVGSICSWYYNLVEYKDWDVFWEIDSVPSRAVAPYYEEEKDGVTKHDTPLSIWKEMSVEIDGKKVKAKILSIE